MSELRRHAEDYLGLRRSLGYKLSSHSRLLPQFLDYLDAADATSITTELAISFAQLPQGVLPVRWAHRLNIVRGFATYLQAIDPATEIPPHDVFGALPAPDPVPVAGKRSAGPDGGSPQAPPSAPRPHL